MTHYVNEEALFAWYDANAREPRMPHAALLDDLTRRYLETRQPEYVLPPAKTNSGQEERYPFRCENIGCCGASTIFYYF